jgi:hypothetical protein
MSIRTAVLSAVLLGVAIGQAQAQYYQPGPPPGPPPGYGYGYDRPHYRPPPPGGRCDAELRTPYGPRRVVCIMGEPRPLGAPCNCPPPGPYAPPAHGRVVP